MQLSELLNFTHNFKTKKEFLKAGSDYLEEKTFHYLSGSLFDIIDEREDNDVLESTESNENNFNDENVKGISDLNQSENAKSRDKFDNLDESYGSTRFGPIFLDY